MAGVAVTLILLLGLAIYSLSRLNSNPWARVKLPAPTLQLQEPRALPPFEFSQNGKTLNPDQFDGKWTLLTFWAHSCPPCLIELPSLNDLADNWNGPPLAIITVNVDEERTENFDLAQKFLQEEGIKLPTFYDTQKQLRQIFDVHEFPRHFLINSERKIVWDGKGSYQWNDPKTMAQLARLMEMDSLQEPTEDPTE